MTPPYVTSNFEPQRAGSERRGPMQPAVAGRQSGGPDATAPQAQRRSGVRRPHRTPCRVRMLDGTTGDVRVVVGETVNLSATGLALQVAFAPPLGSKLETLLPDAAGRPLRVCGTVVRCRRALHGQYEVGLLREEPPAS